MPQLKGQHIDQFLTSMSLQYTNGDYIAEQLAPQVMVEKESDLIPVYSQEMMFTVYETRRADRSEANEVDWKLADSVRYAVEEHALRDIVTDRERGNADNPLQPDIDTLEYLQNSIMLEKEYRVAQMLRNAGNYPANNTEALSGTSKWSDYDNSDPLVDIETMQSGVFKASRKVANTIEFPYQVALTLSRHPKILDLIKYTKPDILQSGDILLPKQLFGMRVLIGTAGYNTAKPGQAPNIDDVWGKDVIVGYVEAAPKLKSLSLAKTFRTGKVVRKWRDDPRRGDVVEVSDINTEMLIAAPCGFLLQNVV